MDNPLLCILKESLDERWNRFHKNLQRLRRAVTVEAVHDVRTASRSLISALDVIDRMIGRRKVRDLRRQLRKLLHSLGPLRDTNIQLSRSKSLHDGPKVAAFEKHLRKQERTLEKKVSRRADRVKAGRFANTIRSLERRLDRLGPLLRRKPKRAYRLLKAIDREFAEVLDRRRALDPADVTTLHRLRIAIKRFRYGTEALRPLLRGFHPRRLEGLHRLQDRLGRLHDMEMISHSLRAFGAAKTAGSPSPSGKKLLAKHDRDLRAAIAAIDHEIKYWRRWSERGAARLRGAGFSLSGAPSRRRRRPPGAGAWTTRHKVP